MKLIDTHSHIQFKIFDQNRDQVILDAKKAGVEKIIAVGTNLETSEKAVEVANQYPEVFAAVGIHPHHVFAYCHSGEAASFDRIPTGSSQSAFASFQDDIIKLNSLISNSKVLAVGETGIDKHIYKNTKYSNYLISNQFLKLQKLCFEEQIKLAIKYKKTLIIHNRQAVFETLEVLGKNWDKFLIGRAVFHCCEPDQRILNFAKKHNVFIGIDGDITYDLEKQEFLKSIPLELLVLETDSPFLTSKEMAFPNTPGNLEEILNFIQPILKISKEQILKNSNSLFNIT